MVSFIVVTTLLLVALADGVALLLGRNDHLLALTGGGFLGIVNFLLLSRIIMNLPAGVNVQKVSIKQVPLLCIVGSLFVVLALWTGQAFTVLMGFTLFVLALMAYAVKEAFHA